MPATVSLRLSATRIYFVLRNHIIEGPFSVVELQAMLSRSEIVPETPVCLPLDRDWVPLFKKVKISGIKKSLSTILVRFLIVFAVMGISGAGYYYREQEQGVASYEEALAVVDGIKKNSFTRLKERKTMSVDSLRICLEKTAAGGDINVCYSSQTNALANAALVADRKMLQFLMKQGARVDAGNINGEVPLMYAALSGNKDNFDYLLEKGADVFAKDTRGWTVLMSAAEGGNLDIIKHLVSMKVDVTIKNKEEKTALDCARDQGENEAAEYLKTLFAQ